MRILSRIYNRLFGKSEYSSWSRNNDFRHSGGFIQFLPAIIAGASAIGGAISGNKAAKQAEEAAKASQVDIDSLDAKTRAIAKQNAFDAAALEQQLTPEVPALRKQSIEGVSRELSADDGSDAARSVLLSRLGASNFTMSPLLQAAITKAKADLDLGGGIDTETRNAVTRAAMVKSGIVSGGLGLGRDLTARDLGLTSLDLQKQRLATAASIGGQEQTAIESGRDFDATNLMNTIQMLQSLSQGKFNKNLSAAQFGQSIAQPTVGLDPGSIADVISQNATNKSAALSNKANIYGQQSQGLLGVAGQMAGYGLMNYKPAGK